MQLARALLMGSLALGAAHRAVAAAEPARATVVVCAPGSPGTTEEAQGAMDAFAAALAARARLPPGSLSATYATTDQAGAARLREKDAAVALVSLPFFLEHEKALRLQARLAPVPQGGAATERWSLVAKKGRIAGPRSLEGFTIFSSAGWSPAFVRGPALGAFGKLPPSVQIAFSPATLSALRNAAAGQPVAVLLDGAQGAALPALPFAADLEVVTRSPELPAGIVARVDERIPSARWSAIEGALGKLKDDPAGAEALAGIRMTGFAPLGPALAAARKAFAEASR